MTSIRLPLGGQYAINESLYFKIQCCFSGNSNGVETIQKDTPTLAKWNPLMLFIGTSLVCLWIGWNGGGILAPILYLLGVAHPKRLTLYTAFIWFNSISGLLGQLQKPLTKHPPYLHCGWQFHRSLATATIVWGDDNSTMAGCSTILIDS